MAIITIPKKLINKSIDLVIIPRKEYEELLVLKSKKPKEVSLSPDQRRSLVKARKDLASGKSLTMYELKKNLGITH